MNSAPEPSTGSNDSGNRPNDASETTRSSAAAVPPGKVEALVSSMGNADVRQTQLEQSTDQQNIRRRVRPGKTRWHLPAIIAARLPRPLIRWITSEIRPRCLRFSPMVSKDLGFEAWDLDSPR